MPVPTYCAAQTRTVSALLPLRGEDELVWNSVIVLL